MIRLSLILFIVLFLTFTASAQTEVCISQEAANKCAELARTDKAKDEKIAALEAKIQAQEVTIGDLKRLNDANVSSLSDALKRTELALATKTGEIIGCQAQNVEQRAIITALLPMVKKKRNAFITIF